MVPQAFLWNSSAGVSSLESWWQLERPWGPSAVSFVSLGVTIFSQEEVGISLRMGISLGWLHAAEDEVEAQRGPVRWRGAGQSSLASTLTPFCLLPALCGPQPEPPARDPQAQLSSQPKGGPRRGRHRGLSDPKGDESPFILVASPPYQGC